MAGLFDDIGAGLGGWLDDITGKNKRQQQASQDAIIAKQRARQEGFDKTAQQLNTTGSGMVGQAGNYWSSWLNNPTAAWNQTAGLASNAAGTQANQAARSAINMARSAGLNPGEAALAGGQTVADTFGNAYLGNQQQLIGNQQASAGSLANAGATQQNLGLGYTGQGTASLADASGAQADRTKQAMDANASANAALGQFIAQGAKAAGGNPAGATK